MKVLLETPRLILREFIKDDVDLLVLLDSDPEVMFYINGGRATPRDVLAEEHVPAYLKYHRDSPAYGFWVALEKSSGDFVGWFHFRPGAGAPSDQPELGYRLLKSAWGKGYATEGSQALIDKGFAELDISRVNAETMVVNTGSAGSWRRWGCGRSGSSIRSGRTGSPATSSAMSSTPSPAPNGMTPVPPTSFSQIVKSLQFRSRGFDSLQSLNHREILGG